MGHAAIGQPDKLTRQLVEAAENGNAGVVETLLAQGADIEARDASDQTALKVACEHAHVDVVRVLLGRGANAEAKSNSKGMPVNWAIGGDGNIPRTQYADRLAVVKMLLDKKVNIETRTIAGITPLMLAAYNYRDVEILRLLLTKGANVEARDDQGRTALMEAVQEDHTDAETMLLTHGAKIDAADSRGHTALMHAVSKGHIDSVSLLLSKGAKLEAVDNEGQTALFRAAIDDNSSGGGDYAAVTKFLIEKGANVNAKDDHGRRPLEMAINSGRTQVAKLLRDSGAQWTGQR